MLKKVFLSLLIVSNVIVSSPTSDTSINTEQSSSSNGHESKRNDSRQDELLKQHFASLDSQTGVYMRMGTITGCVATFAFVCNAKRAATCMASGISCIFCCLLELQQSEKCFDYTEISS